MKVKCRTVIMFLKFKNIKILTTANVLLLQFVLIYIRYLLVAHTIIINSLVDLIRSKFLERVKYCFKEDTESTGCPNLEEILDEEFLLLFQIGVLNALLQIARCRFGCN